MYYLILMAIANNTSSALTIIPEKYPTEQSCAEAGKNFQAANVYKTTFQCIPAPQQRFCSQTIPNPQSLNTPYVMTVPCEPR